MKKPFFILLFLFPVVANAQEPWNKSSQLDNLWHDVGKNFFTVGNASPISLAICPSNGEPYIAYSGSSPTYKATVMKFDGSNWVYVGNANFSPGSADFISLAFSPSGQPYVAFSGEDSLTSQVSVMKFDGTNWVYEGLADFSAGYVDYPSLAFSPSDHQPYVAFVDYKNSGKVTVMKFNSNNWENVGNAGFSSSESYYTSLSFITSDCLPYVAFSASLDPINPDSVPKAMVMKFDGTNWAYIGKAGFSAGWANFVSLAFSYSGQVYVAYSDWFEADVVGTVMKFDGTNWVIVGNKNFSNGNANFESLACSPSGEPFVAYYDGDNEGRASVKRFNGTNWVYVGIPGFSLDVAFFTSLAFSPSGQPYVGSADSANSWKATVMKFDSAYIGINELKESMISLYPNPAKDKCQVSIPKSHIKNIEIYNLTGEKVYGAEFPRGTEDVVELNLDFPAGVYFVRVTNERTVEVGKIIKK